jgi:glycosyltransferase involved in cell wall biosynthesis
MLIERLSCRFADHVIVANHLWHQRLLHRAITAEKSTPLINYPDLRLFSPRPEGRRSADGKFIIVYPGTLNYHQGLDIAVRAFDLAKDRMPNAEFHIYGDGPARPDLAQLTQERGLTGRVKLMDPLPIDQIAAVMASADMGVEPKRAEGFGNEALSTKILEFMACRVPVVVSRTLIHAYYFDDALVRFFPPGHERELAEVFVQSYQQTIPSARLQAAQDFAIRNSWQARAGDYRRVIESLTPPAARPGAVLA